MTITSIQRDFGPNVSVVRIETTDAPEIFVQGGWLNTQHDSIVAANNGPFEWKDNDVVIVSYPSGNINLTTGREVIGAALMHVFPSFASLFPIQTLYPFNPIVTAHAGGGQTNATQLNLGINVVTTVATAADSVKLPDDVLGQTVIVRNATLNAVDIFPFLGDSINDHAANAAVSLAAGHSLMFIGTGLLIWSTIPYV